MNPTNKTKKDRPEAYQGFEQGPIRPPSEAYSLLIRITRSCPWNHCTFCPVYKGKRFSLRPVDHVKQDIDMAHKYVEILRNLADGSGRIPRSEINDAAAKADYSEMPAFQAAIHWFAGGMTSIFLQDANSLIIKPKDLVIIIGFGYFTPEEARGFKPKVVVLGKDNKIESGKEQRRMMRIT